ncbi:D-Ala-D-Ala carboxypeptidase family metallohydrolase [Rhizobium sp. 007]|uniref:YcbK family protein n=1 Tax=Rhizobium sp. 007 TaxID=2785056 RepID=UPI0018903210|nr:D-Ala-D-Ala carboxypeptidase family metallohydrolase [Rhizobium sp. 007]QPB21244.1 YcbK family protein [Rhizobium sp. 007]
MLILQKRMPATGALLIAVAAVALSGCVSNQKALDSAAAVAADPSAEQLAGNTPGKTANGAYRDPMVTNVSNAQQTAAAQDTDAATMSAGPATQPANIGGLAMQPSRINANAMSIFSAQPARPQNNTTSTIIQPADANAYAPVQGIDAARSSVFSAPPPAQPAQGGEMLLPQQSSEKTSTRLAPAYQTTSLATGNLQGGSMNALYAAPKQNLVGGLAGLLEKASLPGMTRVAPNGLHIQNGNVEVGCFKPGMLNVIKAVETHFGKPVIVTSGYRDAGRNRMVGGAEESMHKTCDAADIKIDGVSKWDIAAFIRSLPNRGGVGTYCHTESVHLDTGKSRDWNWSCGAGRTRTPNARAI